MGVKISELNEASSVQNSDVLPIVQNGETKKVTVETLGSQKVNKSGDTMTGALTLKKTSYNCNNGAIPGTKQAAAHTIEDLINVETPVELGML